MASPPDQEVSAPAKQRWASLFERAADALDWSAGLAELHAVACDRAGRARVAEKERRAAQRGREAAQRARLRMHTS
jgi:hypothetical protein